MKKSVLMFPVVLLLTLATVSDVAWARGGHGGRTYYGGGKHSSSHGGHFSGGSGSSHRGGKYAAPSGGRNYGRHK